MGVGALPPRLFASGLRVMAACPRGGSPPGAPRPASPLLLADARLCRFSELRASLAVWSWLCGCRAFAPRLSVSPLPFASVVGCWAGFFLPPSRVSLRFASIVVGLLSGCCLWSVLVRSLFALCRSIFAPSLRCASSASALMPAKNSVYVLKKKKKNLISVFIIIFAGVFLFNSA